MTRGKPINLFLVRSGYRICVIARFVVGRLARLRLGSKMHIAPSTKRALERRQVLPRFSDMARISITTALLDCCYLIRRLRPYTATFAIFAIWAQVKQNGGLRQVPRCCTRLREEQNSF